MNDRKIYVHCLENSGNDSFYPDGGQCGFQISAGSLSPKVPFNPSCKIREFHYSEAYFSIPKPFQNYKEAYQLCEKICGESSCELVDNRDEGIKEKDGLPDFDVAKYNELMTNIDKCTSGDVQRNMYQALAYAMSNKACKASIDRADPVGFENPKKCKIPFNDKFGINGRTTARMQLVTSANEKFDFQYTYSKTTPSVKYLLNGSPSSRPSESFRGILNDPGYKELCKRDYAQVLKESIENLKGYKRLDLEKAGVLEKLKDELKAQVEYRGKERTPAELQLAKEYIKILRQKIKELEGTQSSAVRPRQEDSTIAAALGVEEAEVQVARRADSAVYGILTDENFAAHRQDAGKSKEIADKVIEQIKVMDRQIKDLQERISSERDQRKRSVYEKALKDVIAFRQRSIETSSQVGLNINDDYSYTVIQGEIIIQRQSSGQIIDALTSP